jgi:hypothetical protein
MTSSRPAPSEQRLRSRIGQIEDCIRALRSFNVEAVQKRWSAEAVALEASIDEALSAAFGYGTIEYARYRSAAQLDNGPTYTPSLIAMASTPRGSTPNVDAMQAREAQQYLSEGRRQSIILLQQAIRALERQIADLAQQDDPVSKSNAPLAVGGRPAAEWWDDLWVEMCRQIYTGELVPKRQADLEKAMQSWCAAKGYSDAVSTVRPRARKLWQALFA